MRILLCAVDSLGVAHQLIAIGLELQRRGHDVAFAAGAALGEVCERSGVRRIPPSIGSEETFQIREWGGARSTVLQFFHVVAAAAEHRAQLVVTSPFGCGPLIAAKELGVPLVTVGGVSYLWPEHSGTLAFAREQIAIGRRILGLRRPTSVPPHEYLGDRLLLQGVPRLAGPVDPAVDVRWIGDSTWDPPREPDAELLAWCAAARARHRRIIYVQLGREFGAKPLDDMLAAVAGSSELVFAIDTGRSDRPRKATTVATFARPFIARADVLPYAELVVSTGQPTSVISALTSGLPLVLLPHGSGTEPTAVACERAGVAGVVPGPVTVTGLRDQILVTVDDLAMRRAAANLGAEIASLGGVRTAATFILEVGVRGSEATSAALGDGSPAAGGR